MASLMTATRVQFMCPCKTAKQYAALNRFISYLRRRQQVRQWGGLTYSSIEYPSFTGHFWHKPEGVKRGKWVQPDQNVLLIIDVPEQTPTDILKFLDVVRSEMEESYTTEGSAQIAFWITTHPLSIVI